MNILSGINQKFKIKNFHPERAEGLKSLYDIWASTYPPTAHNPLMRAEQAEMLRLLPDVHGQHALDLACGTGRYTRIMRERGVASVIALDFSAEMLRRVPPATLRGEGALRVCASMLSLPLASDCVDMIVSGLAVGHADNLNIWLCEAARVLRRGGTLLYSDFHPFAAQAGWQRSFRAEDGRTYNLPHHTYTLDDHRAAASAAGLHVEMLSEMRVGYELIEVFDGSEEFYRRWHGKPIVLIVQLRHA